MMQMLVSNKTENENGSEGNGEVSREPELLRYQRVSTVDNCCDFISQNPINPCGAVYCQGWGVGKPSSRLLQALPAVSARVAMVPR